MDLVGQVDTELFPGRVDPRVGSGWVGSGPEYWQKGRVGSGPDPGGSGRVGSKYPDPTWPAIFLHAFKR